MKKVELKISGMHCIGCEDSVKEAILSIKGVKNAKVDYARENAVVDFDPLKTDVKTIVKAVNSAGFEATK